MALKKIVTPDQNLQMIQDNVQTALTPMQSAITALQAGPFFGGQLLTSQAITTGPTKIAHSLGRTPKVWTICDQSSNAVVWRTAWDTTSITFEASAACLISLWVT